MATFIASQVFDISNITEPLIADPVSLGSGSYSITDPGISYTLSGALTYSDVDGFLGRLNSITAVRSGTAYFSITGLSYNADNTNYDAGYTILTPIPVTYTGMTGEFAGMLAGNDVIYGSTFADRLNGFLGSDIIHAGDGADILAGNLGNDVLHGGAGTDTAVFSINSAAVTEVRHYKAGGAYILSAEGSDTLTGIENLQFLDVTIGAGASGDVIRDLIATRPLPSFAGASSAVSLYTGAVAFLEYEYIGSALGDLVAGSNGNDFINLLAGGDAANGGAGDDVIDGGIGSNFLSGGGDNDTFYLDGRGGTVTWSTITDFTITNGLNGDAVNIWGWNAGTSKLLLTQASSGAVGFTGVTFHYDLNNDNSIDTSITFTGLSASQVPASQALSVLGNGYLLIG